MNSTSRYYDHPNDKIQYYNVGKMCKKNEFDFTADILLRRGS